MLGTLTELGLFFKFSPKRSNLLKSVIKEENERKDPDRYINTTKFRVFCETRWVERHIVLEEVKLLYDPILKTLEKVTIEKEWDHKYIDSAFGLARGGGEFLVSGISSIWCHKKSWSRHQKCKRRR